MSMNTSFDVFWDNNKYNVVLDGQRLECVTSYSLHHDARDGVSVALRINPVMTNSHYDKAKIELMLSLEEKELLKKFGWTPPDEPK